MAEGAAAGTGKVAQDQGAQSLPVSLSSAPLSRLEQVWQLIVNEEELKSTVQFLEDQGTDADFTGFAVPAVLMEYFSLSLPHRYLLGAYARYALQELEAVDDMRIGPTLVRDFLMTQDLSWSENIWKMISTTVRGRIYDILFRNGLAMVDVRVIRGRSISLELSERLRATPHVFRDDTWIANERKTHNTELSPRNERDGDIHREVQIYGRGDHEDRSTAQEENPSAARGGGHQRTSWMPDGGDGDSSDDSSDSQGTPRIEDKDKRRRGRRGRDAFSEMTDSHKLQDGEDIDSIQN
jgi:hypothetical protein